MHVQALVANRSVEAFLLAVLPRLSRIDVERLDATLLEPELDSCCHELWAVVAPQVPWGSMLGNEGSENTDHALGRGRGIDVECQTLAGELVHHRPDAQRRAIGQGVLHEVVGPDMTRIGGNQAIGRLAGRSPAARTLYVEPMLALQAPDALLVNPFFSTYQRSVRR